MSGAWEVVVDARRVAGILTLCTVLSAAVPTVLKAQGAASDEEAAPLRLVQVGSEQNSFHVVATLIVGPTESILWDAHYKVSNGKRLAERVAETGTHLKAIVLSHADHDHYFGAMEVLKRFPGTPVYITGAGLEDYNRRSPGDLAGEQRRVNPEVPDSVPSPQALPSTRLTVDGHELEVIPGLAGDVRGPVSSALWIPSLKTVLAADLVFDGLHPWLGDSDLASREAWRASLDRLAGLNADAVIAGHKRDVNAPDSPELLASMKRYLIDFDDFMREAATPEDLVSAMQEKYPDLVIPALMAAGARRFFKK